MCVFFVTLLRVTRTLWKYFPMVTPPSHWKIRQIDPHPPWKIRSLPWGRGGGVRIFSGTTHFEFRSKPSLITVICMDPRSPNKLFATKYSFLILVDDTSFFLFISLFLSLFFLVLFYVIINFYKNNFIIIIFFFITIFFYFFMFVRDVPGVSGMFRHVPECSVFRVLSTPSTTVE